MNSLSLSSAYLRHKTLSTALTIATFAAGVAMIVVLLLVNAQIQRFVSFGRYADDEFLTLFKDAGIEFDLRNKPSLTINLLD